MCVFLGAFVVELFLKWVCIYDLVAGVQGGAGNRADGFESSVSVGCSERFLLAFLSFVCWKAGIVFSLSFFVCVSWWFCVENCFELGQYLCFACWCVGRLQQYSPW